jgi:hypothetical protein
MITNLSSVALPAARALALFCLFASPVTAIQKKFWGDGPFMAFGMSLDFCGDVDGDKVPDIVIGSPGDGPKGEGRAYLYSGKTGKLLHIWNGEQAWSTFGIEVAQCGDVDGDGVADIAIAAQGPGSGVIHVYSGRTRELLQKWFGAADESSFGVDIARIGDVDGDKIDDLLVRARVGRDKDYEHLSERFIVLSGKDGKRLHTITSPMGKLGQYEGRPLCALGDVNHDGVPDFAIEYDSQVLVCSGKDGAILRTLKDSSDHPSMEFGHGIAGPGDVNGDGCADIVIGTGWIDLHPDGIGFVAMFSGSSGACLFRAHGDEMHAPLGFAVAAIGDLDRDGVPDFVASTHDHFIGIVSVRSGKDGSVIRTAEFNQRDAPSLGARVVGGADIDGDGVPDFMASAYWPTGFQGEEGQGVYVFSGRTGKLILDLSLRERGGGMPTPPGVIVPPRKRDR